MIIKRKAFSAKSEAAERVAAILARNKAKIAASQANAAKAVSKLSSPSNTITELQNDILKGKYNVNPF